MAAEAFENDVGTVFEATIKNAAGVVQDISSQTVLQMKIRRSDGTVVTGTASLTTDGTDGKLEYATVSGDLSPVGPALVFPFVTMTGFSGHGSSLVINIKSSP